jgi:hypothetical protein
MFQGFTTRKFETCETLKLILGVQFFPCFAVRGGNGNPEQPEGERRMQTK